MTWMNKVLLNMWILNVLYLDRQWLTLLNTKIKKLGEKECSYDCFEFVMDQLEKEWFNLVRGPRVFNNLILYSID